MSHSLLDYLKVKDVEFLSDKEISSYSYIGIGAEARLTVFPKNDIELISVIRACVQFGERYKLVGNMTNILPPDTYFDGVIIKNTKNDSYFLAEDKIIISSGSSFIPLLRKLMNENIGGFEALSGIPGSVGGMIYNNAGAYGSEISDNLIYTDLYFVRDDLTRRLYKDELDFSYRNSLVKKEGAVVLSAAFKRINKDKDRILGEIYEYKTKRELSQPTRERSLGSVFCRHDGIPVSKLIYELGLSGFRVGDAEISKKHAGFIINIKNATAKDYLSVVEYIKRKIEDFYGFVPTEEIEVLT